MIKRIRQSEFIRSVATLVSGTIIAQIIAFSLSPIITRLYDAEQMSYQSVFTRLVLFITILATARLELAFTLPKRMEHAFSLYRISMRLLFIVVGITFLISLIFLFVPLDDPNMNLVMLMVPFGVLAYAFFNQGTNWAIRQKNFKHISWSKMIQSLFNAVFSIAFYPLGFMGVILANAISMFTSALVFLKDFKMAKLHMKSFNLKGRDFAIFKTYADFPRVNLPHSLVDISKDLFIAFYMVHFFEKEVLGFYDLSFRMLKLPITLIGASIGQVFLKKAVDFRNDGKPIYPLLKKTMLSLLVMSIIPFGLLMVYGETIFSFVFGQNWSKAGYYAQIMGPWLLVNFLISPVSQIPLILNKQRSFFILGIVSAVLMVITLSIDKLIPQLNLNFDEILMIVSLTQFVFLTYILFWLLYLARKHELNGSN